MVTFTESVPCISVFTSLIVRAASGYCGEFSTGAILMELLCWFSASPLLLSLSALPQELRCIVVAARKATARIFECCIVLLFIINQSLTLSRISFETDTNIILIFERVVQHCGTT